MLVPRPVGSQYWYNSLDGPCRPSPRDAGGRRPPLANSMLKPDRTLSSRYECKYLVRPETLPAIRAMVRPFVKPDRFAQGQPGYRYPLSSLYLDSPDLDLYQTTIEAHRNRYKLRVRSYSDDPSSKVYFEIKRRSDQVILKTRAATSRAIAQRLLEGRGLEDVPASLRKFLLSMLEISAEPVLRVRYRREAYESLGRDPVRLTFDTQIEHAVTRTPNLSIGGDAWTSTPLGGVVVEIKFSDACPSWVPATIDRLELVRESIPKYVSSLSEALRRAAHLQGSTRRDQLGTLDAPTMGSLRSG